MVHPVQSGYLRVPLLEAAGEEGEPGPDGAFGAETNRLIILGADGFRQVLGPATKTVLAQQLIALLLQHLTVRAR